MSGPRVIASGGGRPPGEVLNISILNTGLGEGKLAVIGGAQDLGQSVVDNDGKFTFEFKVPEDHQVEVLVLSIESEKFKASRQVTITSNCP